MPDFCWRCAMAGVTFEEVGKTYPDGTRAVAGLSLDVPDGEFLVMVGPSGCGKSTSLRMLAGLEDVTSGVIRIGGDVVNEWLPKERDIAMVFQTHALYPHMTVSQNLGFAMRVAGAPESEARRRIRRTSEMLAIGGLLSRMPRTLSVGERQRVAMGRAVVRQPRVFLMDEPLSSLDAGLRVQTRAEILDLQRRLGVTTIYVTHDQVEAMTMGDRVAVMADGAILQCAAPQQLYDLPGNIFVAAFIGTPAMNLFHSELLTDADGHRWVRFGPEAYLSLDPQSVRAHGGIRRRPDGPLIVGCRPEALTIAPHDAGVNVVEGTVTTVEMLGSESLAYVRAPVEIVHGTDWTPAGVATRRRRLPRTALESSICARISPPVRFPPGTPLRLAVDTRKLLFFDPSGRLVT